MIIDRLDAANIGHFLAAMSDGVLEQLEELVPLDDQFDNSNALNIRDYASQLYTMSEALSEFATTGKPLDWDFLDDHIGTDVVKPQEIYE